MEVINIPTKAVRTRGVVGWVHDTSKGCVFDGKNGRRCTQITLRWQNEIVTGIRAYLSIL